MERHELHRMLAGERDAGSVKLSKSVTTLNENEGHSRLKKKERKEIMAELQAKQEEFEKKKLAVDQTKCGTRRLGFFGVSLSCHQLWE